MLLMLRNIGGPGPDQSAQAVFKTPQFSDQMFGCMSDVGCQEVKTEHAAWYDCKHRY